MVRLGVPINSFLASAGAKDGVQCNKRGGEKSLYPRGQKCLSSRVLYDEY